MQHVLICSKFPCCINKYIKFLGVFSYVCSHLAMQIFKRLTYTKFDVTGNHKQFWKPCMNDFVCTQHGSGKTIEKERNDTV
jgi:hypothetical protein